MTVFYGERVALPPFGAAMFDLRSRASTLPVIAGKVGTLSPHLSAVALLGPEAKFPHSRLGPSSGAAGRNTARQMRPPAASTQYADGPGLHPEAAGKTSEGVSSLAAHPS